MWFIELHLQQDGQPIFINFDKVVTINSSNEGGTIIAFNPNRQWVHVKEDYDFIMKFMIKRMTEREAQ